MIATIRVRHGGLLGTTPDELVPTRHPIREIKAIVEASLTELSPVFNEMYAKVGRASIPPDRLLKSSLLIALYSIRSERSARGGRAAPVRPSVQVVFGPEHI